jgi:glycosyltransferase involved in cell wall biosynthesis
MATKHHDRLLQQEMRILHLINTLSAGGAELHLLALCRYLKQHGVEMVVAYLREQVKDSRSLRLDFEREGIRVVRLQPDAPYDVRCVVALARLLKGEQPAILHTHLPRADLAGAFGHLLYPSVAWVCSIHAIYDQSWSGRWTLPLFNAIWRRADVVVAISYAVKDWLVRERRVPPDKVTVIHYGIEPERFVRSKGVVREVWSLDERAVVGSIGRLEPGKGHDCLIQAMPTVLARVPNASLVIAGHDPWGYGQTLQALIAGLGLHSRVRLVGFQDDISSFLDALDVFALASRSEGFGQVVIEAMAAGKPVVASRIPPLTETVVDGETGLLVEPERPQAFAQAITLLLSHPEKARQMGKQGQERVRNYFSIERETVQTLSLYKTLIGGCAGSTPG